MTYLGLSVFNKLFTNLSPQRISQFAQAKPQQFCLIAIVSVFTLVEINWILKSVTHILDPYIIKDGCIDSCEAPILSEHDKKRSDTYPPNIPNTWYHIYSSKDLVVGQVVQLKLLGQVFVLWRGEDGEAACQNAFCLHQGANLAVGGVVEDSCIKCPFHMWKFSKTGAIYEIPYNKEPNCSPTNKTLKTYPCVEWCGMIFIYFHANDEIPPFSLPKYIEDELNVGKWIPHLTWNIGFKTLSPVKY
jgi:nitrite reductase/ring-hydroxylating ferredoxin subunit